MDSFKAIYRILMFLQCTIKCPEFPDDDFSPEHFKLGEDEFVALLEMLVKRDYIDGVSVRRSADGVLSLSVSSPRITLTGLEYLHSSGFMLKEAEQAKGHS